MRKYLYSFGDMATTLTEVRATFGDTATLGAPDSRDTLRLLLWNKHDETLGETITVTRRSDKHPIILGGRATGSFALVDSYEVGSETWCTLRCATIDPNIPLENYAREYASRHNHPTNPKYR